MKYPLILAAIIGSSAFAVQADSTICTHGEKQRKIEVVYPEDGGKACEVQYTKGDDMQVLWSANSDKDYCAEKAVAFVEKQRGWGWECTSDMPAMEEMPESMEETPAPTESDMMEETKDESMSEMEKN